MAFVIGREIVHLHPFFYLFMIKNPTNEYRCLANLSIPLILTQAGQMVVAVADSAMVGRTGAQYLAASAFANNIFILIMLFGMGITLGITPLVGKLNGEKQPERIAQLLSNAFFTKIGTTFVLLLASAFIYLCMPHMAQPENVVRHALPYFILLVLSLIPLLFFFVFKQFAEGLGNTHIAMRITIVGNLLNVLLNYIFIFGKCGSPALFLTGAGVATLISRFAMLLMMLWGFSRNKELRPWLRTISFKKYSFSESKKLLHVGIPISLQMTAEASIFSLSGIMAGWLGEARLAAYQVVVTISYCSFMIITGFAQAVTIHISTLRGKKAYERIRCTIIDSGKITLITMLLMSLIFVLLRFQFVRFFIDDPIVLEIAARLMLLLVFYQLTDGFQVLGMGILRGFTDVKYPMVVAIISYLALALPGGYLLGFVFDYDVYGIWMGLVIGIGMAAIFFTRRVIQHLRELRLHSAV